MGALFLSTDLMFGSKVSAAATRAGTALATAMSVPAMLEKAAQTAPRLAILDLTAAGLDLSAVVPQLRAAAPGATILAYGPHVQEALLAAAQAAGCDLVLTRGQWNAQMGDLLTQYAGE